MKQLGISKSFYLKTNSLRDVLVFLAIAAAGMFDSTANAQCELQTIWSPDPGQDFVFGISVAGSATMDVIVLGESGRDSYSGAAYIYRIADNQWLLDETFVAPDGPQSGAQFGDRIDMSADGKTVIISEIKDANNGFSNAGAAWVYVEKGGRWVVQQKLAPADAEDGWFFGERLALSADGNVAAVSATGAPFDPVYVFTRNGETWTEAGKLETDGWAFGLPWVDVSADGSVIVVGSTDDPEQGQGAGAVFVFERKAGQSQWLFRQKLLAFDGAMFDSFGFGISLSATGDTILMGAVGDDEAANHAGAAYIFQRNGEVWFQQVKLMADDAQEHDNFGAHNKLTPDGQRAIIKAGNNSNYVFDFIDNQWINTKRITAKDPSVVGLGSAIAITDDGSTVLLGAPNAKVDGVFWYGAAVIFDLEAPPGDLNCDGVISTIDLLELFANWGSCFYWDPEDDCEFHGGCPADLNLDCTVNISDLEILLNNWG